MKKLLVILAVLLLTGCSQGEMLELVVEPVEDVFHVKEMKDLKIGFAQSGNPNPWLVALTGSMEREATSRGVNYVYTDANNDISIHVSNIEDMLEQGLDYLVIAPMENTGLESVLDLAKEKGVPVILAGRTTSGPYVTTVYSDQFWEGEQCAKLIGRINPQAKVVEIRGIEGTSSVDGRASGFREILRKEYPGIKIVAKQTGNFTRTEGMDVMANLINSLGAENIDMVFAHNDEMGIGAIQAIKDAGLVPGQDIQVVSIDGQIEALDAIISGELMASVQCSPLMAPTIFDVIQALINGGNVGSETIVPDKIFSLDNAKDSYEFSY